MLPLAAKVTLPVFELAVIALLLQLAEKVTRSVLELVVIAPVEPGANASELVLSQLSLASAAWSKPSLFALFVQLLLLLFMLLSNSPLPRRLASWVLSVLLRYTLLLTIGTKGIGASNELSSSVVLL
jgi:hypothetical protein